VALSCQKCGEKTKVLDVQRGNPRNNLSRDRLCTECGATGTTVETWQKIKGGKPRPPKKEKRVDTRLSLLDLDKRRYTYEAV